MKNRTRVSQNIHNINNTVRSTRGIVNILPNRQVRFFINSLKTCKVNSSVIQKDIHLKTNRDQLRKMQLQALRLGNEPATLDL